MNNRLFYFFANNIEYIFNGNTFSLTTRDNKENLDLPFSLINTRPNDLRSLCIILNNSCNLGCEYCYANKGKYDISNEQIPFENAVKAIDIFANSVIQNNFQGLSITFFGGEPLLSCSLIRQIVDYIDCKYPDMKHVYNIVTNGTLLNEQNILFLQRHSFNIMVSIDGGKNVHDLSRKFVSGKGSYDIIVKNIHKFKSLENVSGRITVSNQNTDIEKSVRDVINIGIKNVSFALDTNLTQKALNDFCNSATVMFNNYKEDIRKRMLYKIKNIESILLSLAYKKCNHTFCPAGTSYLALSADSKFYLCHRFIGIKDFCVSNQIDVVKLYSGRAKLKEKMTYNNDCIYCPFLYLCGRSCFFMSYKETGDAVGFSKIDCTQKKLMITETLKLICGLSTNDRNVLYNLYDIPSIIND